MASALNECMLSSDEEDEAEGETAGADGFLEGRADAPQGAPLAERSGDSEHEEDEGDEESASDSEASASELELNLSGKADLQSSVGESNAKSFSELGLHRWLCDQLDEFQMKRPTPVQASCIPRVLAGVDVLGCAKTGTGKTLAFALPILHKLAMDPFGIFALILTPTRELAFQVSDQFAALGVPAALKIVTIVGGRDYVAQATDLAKRPHIAVATPGRLADHIESCPDGVRNAFTRLQFLVLDEADRLLDGQYADSLRTIFSSLPKKRQTLLFSATITSALSQLHEVSVKKPYFFEDHSEVATVEQLDQKYVLCPNAVKDAYLVYVVKNFHESHPESSVLIFSHTCRECQALAIMFNGLGFKVGSLHSQISQRDRTSSLTRFRSGRLRVLICTDVAARGLDIPHVDLVVNHNIPRNAKTYVHRVGRSARAGRFGAAITFVTQYDVALLHDVEKLIRKKLEQLTVSDRKVSQYVTQVLVTKREAEIKLDQQDFGKRKEVNRRKEMLMAGFEPEDVDTILQSRRENRKRVANDKRSIIEKRSVAVDKPKKRKKEMNVNE